MDGREVTSRNGSDAPALVPERDCRGGRWWTAEIGSGIWWQDAVLGWGARLNHLRGRSPLDLAFGGRRRTAMSPCRSWERGYCQHPRTRENISYYGPPHQEA